MCVRLEVTCSNGLKIDDKNYDIGNILDEKVELSLLYDYYGDLLKDNHRDIFREYILDDMSLSEIAVLHGITRQGVHDSIKRSTRQLRDYEDKLSLVSKAKKIDSLVKDTINIVVTDTLGVEDRETIIQNLKQISEEV